MADVLYFPNYAAVLTDLVRAAHETGHLDVACRPEVDPYVVAGQLGRFAAEAGRPLRCIARQGKVEVTVLTPGLADAPERVG